MSVCHALFSAHEVGRSMCTAIYGPFHPRFSSASCATMSLELGQLRLPEILAARPLVFRRRSSMTPVM